MPLYDRAARRAGLETEAIKRDLVDIPALVLPAVLIMKNGTALILLGIDEANKSAKVLDPLATPSAPQILQIKAITPQYTGYAFLVRAAAEADARAVAAGDLPRNHWFWSVVKVHWRSYGHIALAAFLINILALAMPLFTMSVYDRVIPNGAIPSLIALSIGMGLAIAFDFVLRTVRSRMIDVTGKTVDVVLAANIFEHVMAVKMAQRPTSVGIIANQLRDFDSVREFFTSGSVVSVNRSDLCHPLRRGSLHHRWPAGLDSPSDVTAHAAGRLYPATSAGSRDEAAASGVSGASRRPR